MFLIIKVFNDKIQFIDIDSLDYRINFDGGYDNLVEFRVYESNESIPIILTNDVFQNLIKVNEKDFNFYQICDLYDIEILGNLISSRYEWDDTFHDVTLDETTLNNLIDNVCFDSSNNHLVNSTKSNLLKIINSGEFYKSKFCNYELKDYRDVLNKTMNFKFRELRTYIISLNQLGIRTRYDDQFSYS